MNISERPNPFTRGITGVTKGPRDLAVPRETPTDQEGIHQLGALFQLSDAQAGMFCDIRRASVYANDLEMGSDLVMFDDFNAICSDNAITLIRGEQMDHPETGEPMILSTYPFMGGFVPVGAKCDDGMPHPHTGSGFAVCSQRGYPADAQGTSWALDQPFDRWRIQEYSYDGTTFRILRDDAVAADGLIPGRLLSHFGSSTAIPDGSDRRNRRPSRIAATNSHNLPSGRIFQHREMLAIWPLAPDRRSVLPPIIRDSADFGPGPYSHPWWGDHPLGCTLRLADGVLRHLLAYRVVGNHEAIYDAAPAPQTDCYVEEVFSVNEPLGIWRF